MKDLSNENIIHTKCDDIEYIQFRRLLEYKEILKHFFIPKTPYFNYQMNIEKIYNEISSKIGLNSKKFINIYQTHSANVEIIKNDNINNIYENTDGIITNKNELVLPIRIADCISIMIFDPNKNVIANIHSGWRGTVQKIVEITIRKMVEEFNCNTYDIICCLTPSIRKCHFEVHSDVKEIFENEFTNLINKGIILNNNNEKYLIDTVLINRLLLTNLGLKDSNIIDSKICTACNTDIFHSYRIEKEQAGRNLSIMSLI